MPCTLGSRQLILCLVRPMPSLAVSWPRIIAISVGGVGLSFACAAWSFADPPGIDPAVIAPERPFIGISVSLLFSAALLATGREWTRRILLVVVILVGSLLLVRQGSQLVTPISWGHTSPEDMPTMLLWYRLQQSASFFLIFTHVIFGILCLSHRDVVASFRRHS